MPVPILKTCDSCFQQKVTIEIVPGKQICFDCIEEPYQVLSAIKSSEISGRGTHIQVDGSGISRKYSGGGGEVAEPIKFTVYGEAKPQGSSKAFVYKDKAGRDRAAVTSDNKGLKGWRNDVSTEAQKHVPASGLINGAVRLHLKFFLLRPPSVNSKTRPFPVVKPDIDKLTRAIMDGLSGKIYTDDARVVDLVISKRYDNPPRVEIEVARLGIEEFSKEVGGLF